MTSDDFDLSEFRAAVSATAPEWVIREIRGTAPMHALQRTGAAMITLAWSSPNSLDALRPVMAEVADRARQRNDVGDAPLADDLTALGAGRTLPGTVLSIDLSELADAASDHGDHPGGYLNLRTGEVIHGFMTDEYTVGEEDAVDIDESEDDWLHVLFESHDGWTDMADFASTITDPHIATSLDRALHGRRPFAHFRDAVHRADISRDWYDFEEERQYGRLRALLAHDLIHPV